MSRLGQLVNRAAEAGARVLAVPLGSRRRSDWLAFEQAMRAHDMLAIVSAGNDGQNIDDRPLWPAALDLPNMLVVTSSDGFGRLAKGSNWGPIGVDLMLPAENIPVTDFRGAYGRASGSSYAVPRLAAIAARLLNETPGLNAIDLRDAILRRAVPSPYQSEPVVAHGWIPDPGAD
jgi:subtilisin family serine protease